MAKNVSPVVSLQDMNFVQTLLYMLDGSLTHVVLESEAPDAVEKVFVFTMIWSMGSALTVTDDGKYVDIYVHKRYSNMYIYVHT